MRAFFFLFVLFLIGCFYAFHNYGPIGRVELGPWKDSGPVSEISKAHAKVQKVMEGHFSSMKKFHSNQIHSAKTQKKQAPRPSFNQQNVTEAKPKAFEDPKLYADRLYRPIERNTPEDEKASPVTPPERAPETPPQKEQKKKRGHRKTSRRFRHGKKRP